MWQDILILVPGATQAPKTLAATIPMMQFSKNFRSMLPASSNSLIIKTLWPEFLPQVFCQITEVSSLTEDNLGDIIIRVISSTL